jgi:cytochrome c oxidase cbb3-type subunit 3
MQRKYQLALVVIFGITMAATNAFAQGGGRGRGRGGAAGAAGASGPARGGGGAAYPSRPPADPAVAARGKATWTTDCASCHAADLRGTPAGVNLVHNQMVLDDQQGELIGKYIATAHDGGKAPAANLSTDQVHDLAIFMHTFQNYRTIAMPVDTDSAILSEGKADAGKAYFAAHCASCHSVTGDLAGIGTKDSDPKALQNALVSGGGGGGRGGGGRGGAVTEDASAPANRRTVTVTVTMADGKKLEGRLISRDDFLVTLREADGTERTIRRNGDVPKVEVHDPMKAHRDMLLTLTDDDIHNLTAYLVTIK